MDSKPLFEKCTYRYCSYCMKDSVVPIIRNTSKGKELEIFVCRECHRKFTTKWLHYESPHKKAVPMMMGLRFDMYMSKRDNYI